MHSIFNRLMTFLLMGALLAACGGGGGGSGSTSMTSLPATQTGTVTMTVSDAPIHNFRSVWMTIDEIRFLSSAGQDILVLEQPVDVDFLQLQNFSELLLRREVVAGTYSKIRLILSKLEVELDDGTIQQVPLNGLRKVDVNPRGPFTVRAGQDLVIDLDLYLDKSIHVVRTGRNERLRFRPVIFAGVNAVGPLDKLFRIEGRVDAIGTPAGMFRVCDIRRAFGDDVNRPQPADICVTVDPDDATPYFDAEVNPLDTPTDGLAELLVNDHVVVYGQFDYDASVPGDAEAGDPMIPAVIAIGQNFARSKGLADSEFRPSTGEGDLGDFDLGAASDVCAIDANPFLVDVQDGAPAFEERPATAEADAAVDEIQDLSAVSMLCRRAEVEGLPDDPMAPTSTRAFIVLLGESPLGDIELVGTLADKSDTAAVPNDYDLDLSPADEAADEVVEVPEGTPMFGITSSTEGDVIEALTAVPTGQEVTVYGTRRDEDGVVVASFILLEE